MSERTNVKVEVNQAFRSTEFDPEFAKEIMKRPGGEKLFSCYQCGACSGSCPVGKMTGHYKPRQIIRMALLGMKKDVLSHDSIWLCASCYTCQERCSQGVEIADLILAMRNIATREGLIPKAFVDQATSLIENGKLIAVSDSIERKRSALGLPSVPPTSKEEVKIIAAITGFDKLIEKLKG
jgi:heterodisulfide reductase subunit C